MENVLICHCSDTFQWLATLNHLHFELQEAPAARTNAVLLNYDSRGWTLTALVLVALLLVINCVGSFYAIDKVPSLSPAGLWSLEGLTLTDCRWWPAAWATDWP